MGKLLPALFVAALGLSVGACETGGLFRGNPDNSVAADTDYVETKAPITSATLDALWEQARDVIANEGTDVDSKRTRFADRTMVTLWDTHLAPNRFEGRRTRLWVRFREAKPGQWVVGVAAQRQVNEDIDAPTEAAHAVWVDRPAVEARAGVVLFKIEAAFREPDAGPAEATGLK